MLQINTMQTLCNKADIADFPLKRDLRRTEVKGNLRYPTSMDYKKYYKLQKKKNLRGTKSASPNFINTMTLFRSSHREKLQEWPRCEIKQMNKFGSHQRGKETYQINRYFPSASICAGKNLRWTTVTSSSLTAGNLLKTTPSSHCLFYNNFSYTI